MKTGRKGEDPTKKKGVEPTKAQSEVKVTAKRPGEPQPKQYTWDDVSKLEATKASNKAKREKYESDMASYNKAMNLYSGGGTPTASESELSVLKGSKVGGKKATFSSNKDIMSAAKENEMYEKGLKSGEYVDIDDPRIDAKTRYFLKGATEGLTSGGDILGEKTGKISVPYEKALGKSKPTKWADVYGGKDFDPYEFEKASKSGKLDQYMNKKGMRPGDLAVSEVGARTQYKNPTKPVEEAYEKEEKISQTDINRIPLPKMELRKPKLEPKNKKIANYTKPEKEAATFEEPTGGIKKRTKYSLPQTTSRGNKTLSGVAVNLGRFVKAKAEAIGKDNALTPKLNKTEGKARLFQGKTGKQAKEFKAYYGAPSSISGSDRSSMTASDIAQERESLKGVKKELRADIKKGGAVSKSELRSELRNVRKDIKATKQAEKYASKNIEARSVYPGGKEEVILVEKPNAGSNPYRGSELGSKYSEFSKDQQIRKSTDNPANRNSTFGRKIKKS